MRNVRLACRALLLGVVAAILAVGAAVAADEPKLTQQEIEKIVHDYLLREPEVLAEALRRLQQRQSASAAQKAKQAIRDNQQALLSDQTSPIEGNAQGKVTIVEFFDYRCVHCRRVASTLENLVRSNTSVRVVYKNFPVLGEPSVLAARAAVAAQQQGGWPKLHRAMLAYEGDFTTDSLAALGASVGLDAAKLKTDMMSPATDKSLQANLALAAALGLDATPSFVIGDRVIRGAPSAETLQAIVDEESRKR
ncbi:MAG TPA: DsbA family protein [Methylomirabilota bacterium]|jgi:protein-disulfide isomerase|nr:DsbA family protein [Methylomirabilota bacterium]